MARNIELKARARSLDEARRACQRLSVWHARERQVDTYFVCRAGRLKLRERDGSPAQLVWYARADGSQPRPSDYELVTVEQPAGLKSALVAALGVLVVVEKIREVYLHQNVRIHLDQVTGLGEFIEFEAVLAPGDDEVAAARLVDRLAAEMGIVSSERLSASYSDLLLDKSPGHSKGL